MEVIIYSKDNCPNCVKAMTILERHSPIVLKLGSDVSRDEFFTKFPGVKTVPQIMIDGSHIGGYPDLEKWAAFQDNDEDF